MWSAESGNLTRVLYTNVCCSENGPYHIQIVVIYLARYRYEALIGSRNSLHNIIYCKFSSEFRSSRNSYGKSSLRVTAVRARGPDNSHGAIVSGK